ncbi:MAG: hypothetical protein IKY52_08565 [Clostridia bacterium]|nr:hypothetical protein [Clostridia bacterium]
MKELFTRIMAALLTVVMIATLSVAVMAETIEFDYARFTATGEETNGTFGFGMPLDLNVVKWAVMKYRTVSQIEDSDLQLRAQFYAKDAGPYTLLLGGHNKQWETVVIDMVSLYANVATPETWTSSDVIDFRFDVITSNRDAVGNTDHIIAVGSQLDIAYIAFYGSEEDAISGTNPLAVTGAETIATAGTYKAEVMTEKTTAPQTFDTGLIAAFSAIVSAVGFVIFKKK